VSGTAGSTLNNWEVELRHSRENWVKTFPMDELKDLKDTEYVNFTGTAVYKRTIDAAANPPVWLNLGKVWGVSELFVNGKSCGVKWYGNRIYRIGDFLQAGANSIEVHVTTIMGNYMKTMPDNKVVQRFINRKSGPQEIQPMGLVGPVTFYS